jgi:hypothetical protein
MLSHIAAHLAIEKRCKREEREREVEEKSKREE